MEQKKETMARKPRMSLFARLLDVVVPRFCCVCGRRLAIGEEELCARCNMELPRTGFAQSPADNELARGYWGIVAVEHCAALFYYYAHAEATQAVLRFKYADHPETAVFFGRMMAREFGESGFFDDVDVIVPVPLDKTRQRQRGYNQSEMLARGIAEVSGVAVAARAVRRKEFRGSQTRLDRWQRGENVKDVFAVVRPEQLKGKHVLLVDDVITTGATTVSLARELLGAGVRCVSIAALACVRHIK